jgi:hypothetical protein
MSRAAAGVGRRLQKCCSNISENVATIFKMLTKNVDETIISEKC